MNARRNRSAKGEVLTPNHMQEKAKSECCRITTTRAIFKKTRAGAEAANDGDCLTAAATTTNKSSYSVGYPKAS